jgi:hypothetical protein
LPELSHAQESIVDQLNNATINMAGAIRRALVYNGLGPKSEEAKSILGQLDKIRQTAIQEMLKDRSKQDKKFK